MKAAWARHWPAAMVLLLAAAALLPLAPAGRDHVGAARARAVEWPAQWDGRTLRPLALSDVERRFTARFPGAIGRFDDGRRVVVLREVDAPTRMLHPAADCFRGLGHRIERTQLERDEQGRLWRAFDAVAPDGERLRVRERIEAADGSAFTDASAWFWAAALGSSRGPWRAVTLVEAS